METRHPVEGYFGSEFLSIYNLHEVTAAWSWKMLKILGKILHFLEKRPLMDKFLKILFQNHSLRHRWTVLYHVVFKFREIWGMGNRWSRSCVTYLTKEKQNFAWFSYSRYCVDCAQNLPGPGAGNVLTVLQISSKSVHFRQSYTWTREYCQNGW